MQENRSRYPSYNVLDEKEHWDDYTSEIVLKRLGPFSENKFLRANEVKMIYAIARHVVYDQRKEILDFVVHHMDSVLRSPEGEDQRKLGVPKQQVLIRKGLAALDRAARESHGATFLEIKEEEQLELLSNLQKGSATSVTEWQDIPQRELFKKLVREIVSAYYSHPIVWSEIGYGGPAYPRGYVRVEKGLTDPWEARRDEK